ncbi:Oligopeptide-binding protein OppA [Chlamydiales bacterium SCGC AG-110-P3]|nr:Oligopeptide-binding protein OppA [Chlamydiales bacterium SCGC AG-110-P3]
MRVFVSALAAGFILLSSCQSDMSQKHPNHLRLNIHTEPPSLHPHHASDTTSGLVLRFLFDGLTRLSANGTVVPSIADTIEVSDDGTVYTFHLRESRWSNGDPVTANHFVYTFRKMMDPTFVSELAYKLYIIKNAEAVKAGKAPLETLGVTALDPYTLIFELEHPAPYFLDMTATQYMFPVHPASDQKDEGWSSSGGKTYISNGPFLLSTWRHHNEITMVKNPSYWDATAVRLETVTLSMVEDAHTELSMFEEAEIDWAGPPMSPTLPIDAISWLREEGILRSQATVATYMYLFNTNRPPLTNKNIRKALAYSINRRAITENITQTEETATTSVVPQELSARTEPFFPDANEETALALFEEGLTELGMTRETMPSISLSYNTSEHHHRIAQYVQQQWNRILGIAIELDHSEWKAYLGKVNTCDFSIARLAWWADYRDAVSFLELWRYDSNGVNCAGWHNTEYEALLEQADYTVDIDQRLQLLLKAETILSEEMPVVPVYTLKNVWVQNPALKGVYISNPSVIDFKWAYFEEEERSQR